MHEIIIKAITTAQGHLDRVASGGSRQAREELRKELKELKKDALIERILDMTYPQSQTNKGLIEQAAYAILEDEDCRALDYNTISLMIKKAYPWAKTTAGSIGWYASEGLGKGKDVKARLSKEILAELLVS